MRSNKLSLLLATTLAAGIASSVQAGFDVRIYGGAFGFGVETPIEGVEVQDLLDDAQFPDDTVFTDYYTAAAGESSPGGTLLTQTSGLVEYPQEFDEGDNGDNYGGAVSFIFYPWMDAEYEFFVRSDDASTLKISSDATRANLPAEPDAQEPACCNSFTRDGVRNTGPMAMTAGEPRFMEFLWKEGGGGDWFQIGVSVNGGPIGVLSAKHVQRDVNAPGVTSLTGVNGGPNGDGVNQNGITRDPQDVTAIEATEAVFFVEFDFATAPSVQWEVSTDNGSTWNPIEGALGTALIVDAQFPDGNGNQYRAMVGGTPSAAATLFVDQDLTAPEVVDVGGSGYPHGIVVTFSKSVDQTTAEAESSYTVSGKTIDSATLIEPNKVLLDIGEFTDDPLTVTVRNVKDRTSSGNTVATTTMDLSFEARGATYLFYDWAGADISEAQFPAADRGRGRYPEGWNAFDANADGSEAAVDLRASGFLSTYLEIPQTGDITATATSDVQNDYGVIAFGKLVPQISGNYWFWIASDDEGHFFLSTDEDPANSVEIADEPDWAPIREWRTDSAKGGPVNLTAGDQYYFEAIFTEGGGGDNMAVGWSMTDGEAPDDGLPISGEYLRAALDVGELSITQQPEDATTVELRRVTFEVQAEGSDAFAIGYQWFRNGEVMPGENNRTLSFTTTLDLDQTTYKVLVFNNNGTFNQLESNEVTLSVIDDSDPPVIAEDGVTGSPLQNSIFVTFNEPVDAATAEMLENYDVATTAGGASLGLTSATLLGDGVTVRLDTDVQGDATRYTVTVNGVTDIVGNEAVDEAQSFLSFALGKGGLTALLYHEGGGLGFYADRGHNDFPDTFESFTTPFNTTAVSDGFSTSIPYFESPFSGDRNTPPGDAADNYEQVVYGWVMPPEDGDYRFAIAVDDNAELWLSTDEDPANASLIANEPQWNDSRQYDDGSDPLMTQSQPIALAAGQRYYVELITQEGGGGDHAAVAWTHTTDGTEPPLIANSALPIAGEYLWSYLPVFDEVVVSQTTPADGSNLNPTQDIGINAVLTDGLTANVDDASIVVTVNGEEVEASITRDGDNVNVSYTAPADSLADGSQFEVVLSYDDTTGASFQETWSFQTFLIDPEGLLPAGTRYIEANDYNYEGGNWVEGANGGPTGQPYTGGAYADLIAVQGVDVNETSTDDTQDGDPDYRLLDVDPNSAIGDTTYTDGLNAVRGTFTVDTNWKIGWTADGEWWNYTRDFPAEPTEYEVYASIASGGADPNMTLQRVTSDPTQPSQTTESLGAFSGAASGDWNTAVFYKMHALGDANTEQTVTLSGVQTLRALRGPGAMDFNYLAFVPTEGGGGVTPTVGIGIDGATVTITYTGTLQEADAVDGPYTDVDNDGEHTVDVTGQTEKYYRARE